MTNQTQRPESRKLNLGALLLLGLVLWGGYAFGKGFLRSYRLQGEVSRLTNEIRAMEMRNDSLRAEIERLHEPEYVERIAREELGLVMPGETLYIVSQPLAEDTAIVVPKRVRNAVITD